MLIPKNGKLFKVVCTDCLQDNIGESGIGGNWVHCFGVCMKDVHLDDCQQLEVTSPEEIALLQQATY